MVRCVKTGMTDRVLHRLAPALVISAFLSACGSMGGPSGPQPAPAPVPQPAPGPGMPAELSQADAEATCLVYGARKFGTALADVQVTASKAVDAGFLVKLNAAGTERTCIIAKDGFVRSLR